MDYARIPGSSIKRASLTKRTSPSADRKRQLIIDSAERIFAARGFHNTTIAHISYDSGVHEASIFQYFKTKENLVVTATEKHLKETLAGISEHLQGMKVASEVFGQKGYSGATISQIAGRAVIAEASIH
ncbi:TetR family transcriptional regulator, partial [Thermodesulfobacteriota bacterium]